MEKVDFHAKNVVTRNRYIDKSYAYMQELAADYEIFRNSGVLTLRHVTVA